MFKSLVSSVVLALSLAGTGCSSRDSAAHKSDDSRLPNVETVKPERSDFPIRIELSAMIEPMEKADLCARVPGVIESLQLDSQKPEVDIGRRVTAGEALVKLAIADLEAERDYKKALLEQAMNQKDQAIEAQKVAAKELAEAREQENRYRAEHTRSKDKHDRTVKLVQSKALSEEVAVETKSLLEAADSAWQSAKAMIETREARLTASAADIKLAQSKIAAARADLQRLQVLVGYATIRAPFDGVVTKRWLDRGAMIKDPATPILTVMRIDTVRVLLDIPQVDVPLVHMMEDPSPGGQGNVDLRVPALRELVPGGKFTGHIFRIAHALDLNTRTMRTEVHLDNKAGYLRPGMYGTATVLLENRDKVLTIPSTALVRRGERVEVFYVANVTGNPPGGVVKRARVEFGLDDGKRVEVRNGLRGDELVVAKGNGVVRDGDRVVAVPLAEP